MNILSRTNRGFTQPLHARAGFTLIEMIVIVIVVGILAGIAVPRYFKTTDKSRASEARVIFKAFRDGYLARLAEDLPVGSTPLWNPNIEEATNESWLAIGMENPNADPKHFFCYDFVHEGYMGRPSDSINAFRLITRGAYSRDYDGNKWIYMRLDTGEIISSSDYQ